MKAGDLVCPKLTCAGLPGDVRCKTALVAEVRKIEKPFFIGTSNDVRVLCKCGISGWFGPLTVEVISESR